MRRPVILSSSICFIVFVLLAPGVVADQAPMWESPIGLTPGLPSTHVQMAAEVVRVEVQQNGTDVHAHVDATFDMVNRGPDERMYVVFPTYASSGIPEDVRLPYSQVYFQPQALSDFRAWTNKETYTPTLRRIRTGSFSADDWYVWNMLYPCGKALQVRVSYTQRLDDITYSGNTRWVPVSYVLRTGALWDGPIGEPRISMSAPDGGGFARRIGQSSELAGELVWTITNFKPTEDIEAEYLTSRVWNRLRDADVAANVQNPTAHDLIDATRSVLETFGSVSLYRKPMSS